MTGKSWLPDLIATKSVADIKLTRNDESRTQINLINCINQLENSTPGVLCLLFLSADINTSHKLVNQFRNLLGQVSRRASFERENPQIKDTSRSNSPSAIRKFFNGSSRKSKEKSPESSLPSQSPTGVQVVVIPGNNSLNLSEFIPKTWWISNETKDSQNIAQLFRCCRVISLPCLTFIDAKSKQIILNDAKRSLLEDLDGKSFPWWSPSPCSVFSGPLLSRDSRKIQWESLNCVKAVFFAANWCPPCRVFLNILLERYKKLQEYGVEFEIIFCSSDRSPESYAHFSSQMPWFALPFGDVRCQLLSRYFNVHGIPALLILDENNELITRHGRNEMLADSECLDFPWYPQKVLELNQYTSGRLKEDLAFILFTEGSSDDTNFGHGLLAGIFDQWETQIESRDSNGNQCNAIIQPVQFVHAGDNEVVDQLMESLGIQNQPLPIVTLLDVFNEVVYVCDQPEVSHIVVYSFLNDVLSDRINPRPIATSGNPASPAHVGGIPMNVISAALGMSPSTMNMANQSPKQTVDAH